MNPLSAFASFFQGGGPFMFIILGVGVIILGLALERFWVISRASSWNSKKLSDDLTAKVRKGDLPGATALAKKIKSPPARIAHAILTSGARDEESLMNVADGEAAVELPRLSRRLAHISLMANTATLLGLLGTIFGLTTAFSAVGAADPSQRSAFLAAGISQALNTTAFGLIVAVPGLLFHGFLSGRVERIVEQVDEVSVHLVRALTMAFRSAAPGRTAAAAQAAAQNPVVAQSPPAQTAGRPKVTR